MELFGSYKFQKREVLSPNMTPRSGFLTFHTCGVIRFESGVITIKEAGTINLGSGKTGSRAFQADKLGFEVGVGGPKLLKP